MVLKEGAHSELGGHRRLRNGRALGRWLVLIATFNVADMGVNHLEFLGVGRFHVGLLSRR